MMMTAMKAVMNDCNHRKTRHLSSQKPCFASLFRLVFFPSVRKTVESEKDNSSNEKSHDREMRKFARQRMVWKNIVPIAPASQGWRSTEFARYVGHLQAERKVEKEVSAEMDAVGTVMKEKLNTWKKSCKESTKREARLFKMVDVAVTDERQEEREREMIRDLLVELRKRKDEEDEARNLIEETQRNLDAAQNKSNEVEQKLNRILLEYIEAFDKERGRARLTMTKHWQMMQSRDTKNLNLEKDLDKILSKVKQTGCSESTRTQRFWMQDEEEEQ